MCDRRVLEAMGHDSLVDLAQQSCHLIQELDATLREVRAERDSLNLTIGPEGLTIKEAETAGARFIIRGDANLRQGASPTDLPDNPYVCDIGTPHEAHMFHRFLTGGVPGPIDPGRSHWCAGVTEGEERPSPAAELRRCVALRPDISGWVLCPAIIHQPTCHAYISEESNAANWERVHGESGEPPVGSKVEASCVHTDDRMVWERRMDGNWYPGTSTTNPDDWASLRDIKPAPTGTPTPDQDPPDTPTQGDDTPHGTDQTPEPESEGVETASGVTHSGGLLLRQRLVHLIHDAYCPLRGTHGDDCKAFPTQPGAGPFVYDLAEAAVAVVLKTLEDDRG